MLFVPPLFRCGRNAHLEDDPTLLLFLLFLFLAPLCRALLQHTRPSVLFVLLVLFHVGQTVHGILRQRAETFGHDAGVGIQDGGQVWLGQLLPVMECQ